MADWYECMNATKSCSNNGNCTENVDGDFSCVCTVAPGSPSITSVDCSQDMYSVWGSSVNFFYLVRPGVLFSRCFPDNVHRVLPGRGCYFDWNSNGHTAETNQISSRSQQNFDFCVYLLYVKGQTSVSLNFHPIILNFFVVRWCHGYLVQVNARAGHVVVDPILYSLISNFGTITGLSAFLICLYIWYIKNHSIFMKNGTSCNSKFRIDLISRTSSLSDHADPTLLAARKYILISMLVYAVTVIISLALSLVSFLGGFSCVEFFRKKVGGNFQRGICLLFLTLFLV